MTRADMTTDLDHALKLARDGADTPLLGGPIGLMWGILLMLVLAYQYLILSGVLGLSEMTLAFAWIAYGVIGGLGTMILSRQIDQRPGANSINNRVQGYVWTMFGGAAATLVIGVLLTMLFNQVDHAIWNIILVFAFAAQGMAYGIIAKLTKTGLLHATSFASFALSAIAFILVDSPDIYLLGSIGAAITIIIPNLILNSRAKSAQATS